MEAAGVDETTNRIEKLFNEIKKLSQKNGELTLQNSRLRNRINTLESQLETANADRGQLVSRAAIQKEEMALLRRKQEEEAKHLRAEVNRNDVFRQVYKGSSKTARDEMCNNKVQSLQKVNNILMDMILSLSKKYRFDSDVCISLCEIATGIDDPVLQHFLDSLSVCAKNDSRDSLFLKDMDEFKNEVLRS